MRTLSTAALAAMTLLTLGACKKDEPPPPAATTTTAAPTSTAKPCSGMASAKDCESCCNPKFHPGWKFTGGKCDCGK